MLSGVPIPTKNGEVIAAIVDTMLLTHGLVTEVSGVPPPPQAVAKKDKSNIVCFIGVIIHQDTSSYTGYYSYYFYYNITDAACCSVRILFNLSAQKEAAGASGLTIGVMLHVPLI